MEVVEHAHIEEIVGRNAGEIFNESGGSAANTIVGLSRLGISCTFLGKLGRDELGKYYHSKFSESGVCTNRFKYCDVSPTGRCLSMVTPDTERTCRTFLGAAMTLSPDEISVEDFAGCTHAHLEGYKLFNRDLALKILACVKEAGCTVSLDLASFEVVHANQDILDHLLSEYIDIVFANEDEAKAYCGSDDPEDALRRLSEHCDVCAVKVGAKGAYLKRGNEVATVSAESVKAVDTTGAGDLWAAGFLYGHYQGWDLENCGRVGSVLGASVVQQLGAIIPDTEWQEIKQRIEKIK